MKMHPVVKEYRKDNPHARAPNITNEYGSSSVVRRVYCTFCGDCIATRSKDWPETKRSEAARAIHWRTCDEALKYSLKAVERALVEERPLIHIWDARRDFETFDQREDCWWFITFCGETVLNPWEEGSETCEACLLMRLHNMAA